MNNFLRDLALLILRLGFSASMMTHGFSKFQKVLNGDFSFGDPIGVGEEVSLVLTVIGEFICPILIILGIKTKWMAVPVTITMAVAAFVVHGGDPFQKKEMALLYFFAFFAISILGGGRYSFDGLMKKM